jgi:hypothetical protein
MDISKGEIFNSRFYIPQDKVLIISKKPKKSPGKKKVFSMPGLYKIDLFEFYQIFTRSSGFLYILLPSLTLKIS